MVDALTAAEAVATPARVAAAEAGGAVIFETRVVLDAAPTVSFKWSLDAVALLFESTAVLAVPLLFVVELAAAFG